MSAREQTGRTSGLLAGLSACPPVLLTETGEQNAEQKRAETGRSGWYVRALTGSLTDSSEQVALLADDALDALMLAVELRRTGQPGWRVTVRRYGTTPALLAA